MNEKKLRFITEYLIDLNATQAAIRAGYSKTYATTHVYKLLDSPDVKAEIDRQIAERSRRTGITQDRVLLEIARLAFNDPRKAFDDKGNLLDIKLWPDEVAAAISAIKITEQRIDDETVTQLKEIKFWDKGKQLELAGRHLNIFTDKHQVEHSGGVKIIATSLDERL